MKNDDCFDRKMVKLLREIADDIENNDILFKYYFHNFYIVLIIYYDYS